MEKSRPHPCEFWEYLQQFLPCEPTPTIQEPVPTPKEPITYEPPVMTQPTPIVGFDPVQPSVDRVYYYHGDHLNSSTYVTDDNGRPVAYYDYLPFGEVAVEHNQTTNFNNGYKFNAKELDEATGMSYYGARYYDSRLSIFVSVDPLAEEFVGWTPYHYVHQNPINLIDPTGMSADGWIGWKSKDGKEHVTYDSDVNTVEEAIAKGYTNVEEVMESGYLVSSEGFYQLNSNGTVLIEEKNELVDVGFYPIRTQDGVLINENNQIKSAAQGFQRGGEFMTYLGLGLSITGVGAKAGGAFIAIGEGMSFAGTLVESFYLYNQGRTDEALMNLGISVFFHFSGKIGKQAAKRTTNEKVLNQSSETLVDGINIATEKTFEKDLKKR